MANPTVNCRTNINRRADWLFLMPGSGGLFRHMVVLGGSAELAERIVETGIAQCVSLKLPDTPKADVVAVLSQAQVAPNVAAGCLVPGGALYYEVDRRSPSSWTLTPGRLRHRLAKTGLTTVGVYWAAPNFGRCKRYIPLDVPEAFQWYLSTLFVAGTVQHRLLEIAVRLYAGARRNGLESLVPCYALTAIASPEKEAAASVTGLPSSHLGLKGSHLRTVVLTSGQDDGSRAVVLPFTADGREPSAVFKISALPDLNENTGQEQAVLTEIRAHLQGSICGTIPEPLGLFHCGDLVVSVESWAAGQPILVSSGRWRASLRQQIEDLRIAANWLTEFHRQAQIERLPWNEATLERWIEVPIRSYVQTFGITGSEERLFCEVRKRARALLGASLPIVWMHYDYGPWNLYRSEKQFMVIDWEFGRNWERDRFGPALYDLLYFVTYWIHVVQHLNNEAAELDAFYKLFIEPDYRDEHSTAVHHEIAEYMDELNIDRRFLPLLLVYVWIEQALHQFSRKQVLGETGPDARMHNRCVRYIAFLAEHSQRLFSGAF